MSLIEKFWLIYVGGFEEEEKREESEVDKVIADVDRVEEKEGEETEGGDVVILDQL